MKPAAKVRVCIRLSAEDYARLVLDAQEQDTTPTTLCTEIVENALR
jgi:hypothetical protein